MQSDAKTVAESNIKENGFVVIMVKAPAAAAPTTPVSKPAPAPTPVPVPAVKAEEEKKPDDSGAVEPMDTTPDSVSTAESTLLTNAGQIEATVAQLTEMGFPRDEVVRALRAAFNNPNRAVEYLMSGHIPDMPQGPPPQVAAAAGAGSGTGGTGVAPPGGVGAPGPGVNLFDAAAQAGAGGGGGGEDGDNVFGFLRHNPQFNALRFMVQQNPALLQPILGQLGASNPELLQLITQHQAEFTALLNEPVAEADMPDLAAMEGMGGGGAGGGGGGVQIQLTQEEAAAIERLMGLGFQQQAALEAYLSCDKNEEMAANYLLEHGMDYGDDEGAFEEGGFEEGGDDDFEEGGDFGGM